MERSSLHRFSVQDLPAIVVHRLLDYGMTAVSASGITQHRVEINVFVNNEKLNIRKRWHMCILMCSPVNFIGDLMTAAKRTSQNVAENQAEHFLNLRFGITC